MYSSRPTNWFFAATTALLLYFPASFAADDAGGEKMLEGTFKPDWESLKQYKCPDWFRDAKFGIWAHWGPQCQPEAGDWYARNMYNQGSNQNKYHVEHYGHPSKVGFKDICNIWKADKFDPDKLIELYKRAGAKYFVQMANHHCNFDNWDSKYQPWNSVKIGPKKDIVGMWEKAARSNGLRFGVTVHAARSWSWYEYAQGSDSAGPMKGVPYDGKLTKADGKGQWWDGLNPQDLYAQNHKPGEKPDKAYCDKFFNRVIDLVNKYKPDLLYFDDGTMPLNNVSDAGLRIAAHYYNSSMQWHNGNNEAVMNTKGLNEEQRQCLVWDIERGKSNRIEPYPWQTDTCIGGWHYAASIFERHGYKTPTTVIHLLVDIVSKNGNMLLNIPVKGDGTIDSDEVACLEGVAKWMEVNSEAIFSTRPWKVFGEGTRETKAGNFNEGKGRGYTSDDIRFTTKGDVLYVIALAWPEQGSGQPKLTIKSLGKKQAGIKGDVSIVQLLGSDAKIEYAREDNGLVVTLPSQKPCEHAWVLKIKGLDLAASEPREEMTVISSYVRPDQNGNFHCSADDAEIHGKKAKCQGHGGKANIGAWDDPKEWVSWKLEIDKPGTYEITARCSSSRKENEFEVEIAGQKLAGKAPKTPSWDDFENVKLGKVEIKEAGKLELAVRPLNVPQWKAINLNWVNIKKVQ